jgi:adenylate cyclase
MFWIGETLVRLFDSCSENADEPSAGLSALENESGAESSDLLTPPGQRAPGVPTLVAWFETLTALQGCLAQDKAFYRMAAMALFEPGGFDSGIVLLRDGESWKVAASYIPNPGHNISWNGSLLDHVCDTGQTLYQPAAPHERSGECCSAIAPIRGAHGEIIGAVCGVRVHNPRNKRRGVRQVEAHFLRLVAQAVSMTIARGEREKELAGHDLLLRQLFPPHVVECLRTDPGILDGREREVTTMFLDLRNYSTIVSRLPPRTTWQMITDLMDEWTELVIRHQGAIVDYYGDGLAAFWNAPADVADHPAEAVRCAFQIRASLTAINDRWSGITGMPLDVGIGIATGMAQTGNCGSRKRIKYGPHGRVVNLARRLEACTSFSGIPILVSEETARRIGNDWLVRRVFVASLKGESTPQAVWQPLDMANPHAPVMLSRYELALALFEAGEPESALKLLDELLETAGIDQAANFLSHWIRRGGPRAVSDSGVDRLPVDSGNRSAYRQPEKPVRDNE